MEFTGQLTVSELTQIIKGTLEEAFYGLNVEGEVSNFKCSNGHWYFRLKDEKALINAVAWRSNVTNFGFIPHDGQKVKVKGNITVYEPQGSYQLSVYAMEEYGDGDILAKLEQRKRKYAQLGYFDEKLKKQIPQNPSKVAVVTSPTGAAIQDILQITGRRSPNMDIVILPALVQGDDAAHTIACRIQQANIYGLADVLIVGRGGGSLEDLLPFSDEEVIEAIHMSEIPVISAVGHEIDWAISDFVADLRAPTPSAAAELVCQTMEDKAEIVKTLLTKMRNEVSMKINNAKLKRLTFSVESAKAQVTNRLFNIRMSLETGTGAMKNEITRKISNLETRLGIAQESLKALNPKAILERGFAIVTDENGKTVKKAADAEQGNTVSIKFAEGKVQAVISEVEK